ncbi:hypothetical protein ACWGJ2_19835 [Streptomyces sp. NPDC054796]
MSPISLLALGALLSVILHRRRRRRARPLHPIERLARLEHAMTTPADHLLTDLHALQSVLRQFGP